MSDPERPASGSRFGASDAAASVEEGRHVEPAQGPVELAASVAEVAASTVLDTAGTIADVAVSAAGAAASGVRDAAETIADRAAPLVRETAATLGGAATSAAGTAASVAGAAAGAAAAAAGGAAKPVAAVARPIAGHVDRLAANARRELGERDGARTRRVRRRATSALPWLFEVHPEARDASVRDVGLRTVPIDAIRGTAVGGSLRGGDFLPVQAARTPAWQARWQRMQQAVDSLVDLPPAELYKFDDGYWVIDGHNRVAAALYNGQVALDATVQELRVPGGSTEPAPADVGAALQGSSSLRAAGAGRLTRTTGAIEPSVGGRSERERTNLDR